MLEGFPFSIPPEVAARREYGQWVRRFTAMGVPQTVAQNWAYEGLLPQVNQECQINRLVPVFEHATLWPERFKQSVLTLARHMVSLDKLDWLKLNLKGPPPSVNPRTVGAELIRQMGQRGFTLKPDAHTTVKPPLDNPFAKGLEETVADIFHQIRLEQLNLDGDIMAPLADLSDTPSTADRLTPYWEKQERDNAGESRQDTRDDPDEDNPWWLKGEGPPPFET